MLTSLVAAILMQPAGVFPFAFERVRLDGKHDVVLVKDSRDKGSVVGQGTFVTQIPREGGCVFIASGSAARLLAFDASGKKLLDESKAGFASVGRPAVDPTGRFVVAEFVGSEESEIWRYPLNGRGQGVMLSVINKGSGTAHPAFEMDGRSLYMRMGGSWVQVDVQSAETRTLNVRGLMDGLPNGTEILEIRPSPTIPKQVAVTVKLPGADGLEWVMAWNRDTDRVSRVSPEGVNSNRADWSKNGQYVLFESVNVTTGRRSVQAVLPTGGTVTDIAVIKDAGT